MAIVFCYTVANHVRECVKSALPMLYMYYLGVCQYMQKAKVTLKNRETIAGTVSDTQVNLLNAKAYSILIAYICIIVIPLYRPGPTL